MRIRCVQPMIVTTTLVTLMMECDAFVPLHFSTRGASNAAQLIVQQDRKTALHASSQSPNEREAQHKERTSMLQFLTQRSIQSFMFLCTQCRDPHTPCWIEEFGEARDLLSYHGTGAFNTTRFARWDSFLLQLMQCPSTTVTISTRSSGKRSIGGWSKNNPYIQNKEHVTMYEHDIDPPSLAARILSVREQLAREISEDTDLIVSANDQILESYHDRNAQLREEKDGGSTELDEINAASGSFGKKGEKGLGGDSDFSGPYGGRNDKKWAFTRVAVYMLNNYPSFENMDSSPLRKSNFDLLYLLSTQESIHRLLKNYRDAGEKKQVAFVWLRDFYSQRVKEYFDGNQRFGRADDFLEDLLLTSPSMKVMNSGKIELIDPLYIAEDIIRVRREVALEWKNVASCVPDDHIALRKELFTLQMEKWSKPASQIEKAFKSHVQFEIKSEFE